MTAKIEEHLKKLLDDDKLSASDRLRALEIGAKVLLARHKTQGGSKTNDFFD